MYFSELILQTAHLSKQIHFYTEVLKMEIQRQTADSVSFLVGRTLLTFEASPTHQVYHFAINIPGFQEVAALEWLKERVKILKDGNKEIHDFSNWNARAIYFYDADQNIVELIARRNLGYAPQTPFDQQAFREVSEIGVSTLDIGGVCHWLEKNLHIPLFSGAPVEFCAMGEECALFICVNANSKKWFPTKMDAALAPFEAVLIRKKEQIHLQYNGNELDTIA